MIARARVFRAFGVLFAVCLAAWTALRFLESSRVGALMEAGRSAKSRGDFATAAARFAEASALRPRDDEALAELALCETELGRLDDALKTWERIGPSSPYAGLAAALSAPILLERGRYALAETSLRKAIAADGPWVAEARERLARALRFEDRTDESREILVRELRVAKDLVRVLRDLWLLDFEAAALERTRALLQKAERDAPDDDRVRLGLAALDRREGRLESAEKRLRSCIEARPNDPAVWRAWLAWSREAGRPDEALKAAGRLASERFSKAEILDLRAWFARRAEDPNAERRELEALVKLDPAASAALERLAELDLLESRPESATARRRRKAEIDAARESYHRLFEEPDDRLALRAVELARVAESLGRSDEAQGWWTVSLRSGGDAQKARDSLARLTRAANTRVSGRETLADLVADCAPSATKIVSPKIPGQAPTAPRFIDEAQASGLRFVFDPGRTPERRLPETMSGGVGVLDFDGDGRIDVYCVQGGPLVVGERRGDSGDKLFRGRADGSFEDVTEAAGIASMPGGYGHGVAVGDFDEDGRPDLFVTRFGAYALYRNRGDGAFEDRTEAAGLGGPRGWPTSAAFADFDGDGDLDLYVCHYLRWNMDDPPICLGAETKRPEYCAPKAFEAEPDRLFRNDRGRFTDVSAEAGIVDRDGRGLGVLAADLDDDGRTDLFVANDTSSNFAFFNEGGMKFREQALESGLASNASGGFLAGMGVACGDADGDGRPDLVVTNFYDESTTFYRNLGRRAFADQSAAVGTALPSRYLLGFGASFLDYDNDGRLDLVTANGHVNDSRPLFPYAMPMQLLAGVDGRFADVTSAAGPPLSAPRVARGLAVGDLDNDGRVDLLVVSQGEPLSYLRNRTAAGRSLTLALEATRGARDAVGAKVIVRAAGRVLTAWRTGGGSYLSASDPRLIFGLGAARRVDSVEVRWPSGRADRFENLEADAAYLLREAESPRRLR